ncbi:hypothetical protein ACH436_15125 [Isoptericola sp. NPDC019693]|uniref:hypothetical protein n=1 Tax=Isoptericola sp. NPDC019693 TaxID=3364009 RepID=UPI0037B74972
MRVTTPGGDTFRVHRRWLPWRPRMRDVDATSSSPWDLADLDGELPVVAVVLLGVAVVVLLPLVLLTLLFLGEALVLLLLLPAFVLARVAFGKPWTVEVSNGRKVVHAEPVVGWRAAGERARVLAAELQARTWEPSGDVGGRQAR